MSERCNQMSKWRSEWPKTLRVDFKWSFCPSSDQEIDALSTGLFAPPFARLRMGKWFLSISCRLNPLYIVDTMNTNYNSLNEDVCFEIERHAKCETGEEA